MQEKIQGYRLSPQQKHLWLLLQRDQSAPYYSWCAITIKGELDSTRLREALQHVVTQHEILLTTFQLLPGMTIPVQVIAEPAVISAKQVLTELADHEFLTAFAQLEFGRHPGTERSRLPALQADLYRGASLVLQAHSLCADGPSLQILARQIANAYAALQRGDQPVATEVMQYADFAEWQNEMLESEDAAAGRKYWSRLDLHQALARRMSFAASGTATEFRPQAMTVSISGETAREMERLAQENSVPVASFFLACWQILLAKSNGWEEPISGVAFEGRKFDELKEGVGLMSSFLPIQSDLSEPLPFVTFLRQLNDHLDEAIQYEQYFSWDQLSGQDEVVRFFPICFEFRTLPPALEGAEVTFTVDRQESCWSAFKLKLVCEQQTEKTEAKLHYDPNVFSAHEVRLVSARLGTLIEQAVRNPATSISDFDLLGSAERQLLLAGFNDTAREFPEGSVSPGIHKLFEAQVEQNPANVALVFEDEQLTYTELNRRANQLAHRLLRLGVGPDVPVALHLDRSIDLVVGLLGILKAGGAYVPLDPGLPQKRLSMMIEDAGARVLVTRGELAAGLSNQLDQVVRVDADRELLAAESTDNPDIEVSDHNLVYIIFTSGSTGRPKGVAVEHRQLSNYLNAIWERLELPAGSSFATVSTVAADLGNTVLFPPLCKGGTLHLISEERATNPDSFADYCGRHAIDCLKIVPAHLSALLSAASPAKVLPRRRLVLGGEASTWNLIEKIKSSAPDCEILNHYGPTEATVGAVSYNVERSTTLQVDPVPLGLPLANVKAFILDEQMRLVPIGAPGELYLGGAGLARGYINRPDATAEKFVPDPFGEDGSRLYRTGDRVRHLSDGRIDFLGRVDDQVKIHGFRIEPREIDMALREHPAVETSVSVAREDQPTEKRLVAYCVTKNQQPLDAAQLRTFLKDRLPEYMLPSAFVFLRQLPLTGNGKIDRQALPLPDRFRPEDGTFAAPRNQVEETLAKLWATVLGVKRVGINDNFFELGGDSILSIQIIARANQAGLRLSPRQLFQHQTVAELASVAGTSAVVAADQGLVTGVVPLTPVQSRFFEQDQPAPHYYNQAMLLQVDGSLDPTVLESACERLFTQHDALRLRFARTADGWTQRIANPESVAPFECIDLSHLSSAERQDEFLRRAARLQASLDLQNGPLVRAALFDRADEQSRYLLIIIHHLATDGVSWSVLLEDLQTLCKQISAGRNVELPPKTTSFKSWAQRLVAHARSEALLAEAPFWLSLSESSSVRLPSDEQGANTAQSARTVSVSLDADETRRLLHDVPVALRTQINEVLLTALARALSDWTGSQRLLIDLEGHGREDLFEDVDLTRTVGWFTTIFPVVLDISDSRTPIDALRLVKEQLRAIPGRGLGYGLLRYARADEEIEVALRAQQQAEVRFNYLGQLDRALPQSDLFKPATEASGGSLVLPGHQLQSPLNRRGYLLNIIGSVSGGELRLEWSYSINLHRRETVEMVAANYVAELRELIAHSQKASTESFSPSDFPGARLSQDDLSKVLARLGRSKDQQG